MTNILNNGNAGDQNPGDIGADQALDPIAPQEPKLNKAPLGVPAVAREPEGTVGSGMNPP